LGGAAAPFWGNCLIDGLADASLAEQKHANNDTHGSPGNELNNPPQIPHPPPISPQKQRGEWILTKLGKFTQLGIKTVCADGYSFLFLASSFMEEQRVYEKMRKSA
jgi:hypothetical protein